MDAKFEVELSCRGAAARLIPISPGLHRVGAAGDCSVRVMGPGVGPHHAQLNVSADGRYELTDLGCSAGTRVNGERVVTSGPLGSSDRVHIGDCEFRIRPITPEPQIHLGARRQAPASSAEREGARSPTLSASAIESIQRLHQTLLDRLDLRRQDVSRMSDTELRELARVILEPLVKLESEHHQLAADDLMKIVLDEALGLGPLEGLLADDETRELMINGPEVIFAERNGRLVQLPIRFSSEIALRGVIERIVTRIGRRVDEASPMVDARLPDGSRVNVVLSPLAVRGTAVTIRRFGRRRLCADDLIARGSLDAPMLEFLGICVSHRRNILVSGGTGSGKTTLLNVLSGMIPIGERVVTIEDSAELAFEHPNLVALESRPTNIEGRGEITIRDLVRNALRMRPDRIVVGECRGGEALDMLQAMNTGHDGSLSTVHANSPRELLSRLEVMVLMSGVDLPVSAIREQISASVHIIVHQARYACGTRRITRITELTGFVGGTIQTQDLFRFEPGPTDREGHTQGRFVPQGHVPHFYDSLETAGVRLDRRLFAPVRGGE